MNIPNFLDRKTLAAMAAPGETHAVRVILLKVNNSSAYRLRSRLRQYLFERDGTLGAHVLDIPQSVWMAGQPQGVYRDNPSISHDLQPTVVIPLVIQVIPWAGAETAEAPAETNEPAVDLIPILGDLLEKLNAPPVMTEALDVMRDGNAEAFRAFVDSVELHKDAPANPAAPQAPAEASAPPEPPAPAEQAQGAPNIQAQRMREYRARKKQEKAAAKKTAKKTAKTSEQ